LFCFHCFCFVFAGWLAGELLKLCTWHKRLLARPCLFVCSFVCLFVWTGCIAGFRPARALLVVVCGSSNSPRDPTSVAPTVCLFGLELRASQEPTNQTNPPTNLDFRNKQPQLHKQSPSGVKNQPTNQNQPANQPNNNKQTSKQTYKQAMAQRGVKNKQTKQVNKQTRTKAVSRTGGCARPLVSAVSSEGDLGEWFWEFGLFVRIWEFVWLVG
jgi:hypothetical protein